MRRLIEDRGVQAAAAAAVTIGCLAAVFAGRNTWAWITLGAGWAITTMVAVINAARRAD